MKKNIEGDWNIPDENKMLAVRHKEGDYYFFQLKDFINDRTIEAAEVLIAQLDSESSGLSGFEFFGSRNISWINEDTISIGKFRLERRTV